MDTYASLRGLATSFYKNKRNAVELILREAISNAIHACIIQYKQNENNKYLPEISIIINSEEKSIKIEDNGIGFSEDDKRLFFDIAKSNILKQENKLPSKGLGRLVFIYFAKNIHYETTHNKKFISFEYPQQEDNLFKFYNQKLENTYKDCPFQDDFESVTMKHCKNKKWFALLMNVNNKLYLNVKTDPNYSDILRNTYDYIIPAYHMNKEHWNTIIIDEKVDKTLVKELIEQSYQLTK